jgi:hypothetical protein
MGKTPPAHTPTLLVEAGSVNGFSNACVKELIKAGYNPEDFGSYSDVKKKINKARRKCRKAKKEKGKNYNPTKDPDPATARLARSDPGHMSQNALYQTERGNACTNNRDPPPGATGYDGDMAPCMPHGCNWSPEQGRNGAGTVQVGTTHNEICRHEADAFKDPPKAPGQPVTSAEISNISKGTAKIAVDGVGDLPKIDDADKLGEARKNKRQENAQRKAAAEELKGTAVEPADPKKAAGTDGKKGAAAGDTETKPIDKDSAAECIEAWRQAEMAKMRKKVVDQYGSEEGYQEKKEAADKALKSAKKREAKAKAAAKDAKGKEKEELERKAKDAKEWREKAEAKRKGVDCLRDQANQLKKDYKGGPYPGTFSGTVPGQGR